MKDISLGCDLHNNGIIDAWQPNNLLHDKLHVLIHVSLN